MAVAPMDEADIIEQIYSAYENDDDTWSATTSEYLTARNFTTAAIKRWANLEGVNWDELFTKLADAGDGDKTVTADDYEYDCPTDMNLSPQPNDYVRIENSGGASSYFKVIPLVKVQQIDDISDKLCWITGNPKLGYVLNINSGVNLSTGDTIQYEYYRNPTYFTAIDSVTEMANPMFIVHHVLWRLYKNDGLLTEAREELQMAEDLLDEMKANNTEVITDDRSGAVEGFGV